MQKLFSLMLIACSLMGVAERASAQAVEHHLRLNEFESALVSGIPLTLWLGKTLYHPDSAYLKHDRGWKNPIDAAAREVFHNRLFQNREKLPAAISDHLLRAVTLYPLFFFPRKNEPRYEFHQPFAMFDDARFLVSYLEAQSATLLATQIAKYLAHRQRPWVAYHNFSAPLYRGDHPERANVSFFSGHSSAAFTAASFHHRMLQRFQGKSFRAGEVWGVYLAATLVGVMRISADKHYFTDVLTGAAVGTLLARWVVDLSDYEVVDPRRQTVAPIPLLVLRIPL